jgi:hypothetical protein
MRTRWGFSLALVASVLAAAMARAAEAKTAKEIVAKAIKAMGGAKQLEKNQLATWKEKGTYYGMGEGQPYKGEFAVDGPGKFRMEIEGVFIIILNGDQGWMKAGGKTMAMTKEQLASQIRENKAGTVTRLYVLKNKAFQLEDLGEVKVDKKPALGVKVTRKDFPEVKLFFDPKTSLLLKAEYQAQSQEKGKEVLQEVYYQDYKKVNDALVPHKIHIQRDGKKFVEAEIIEWKAHDKLDSKLFAKP